MDRILKIGADVHKNSFTLCALESRFMEEDVELVTQKVDASYKEILKFIGRLKEKYGNEGDQFDVEVGYEAGCLGYTLYRDLTNTGIKCVILAPSTMLTEQGRRIKTDARDARLIAACLSKKGYKSVNVPDPEDVAVKEFIRMRSDHVADLKRVKQWIKAFVLRHGYHYDGSETWTSKYESWLKNIDFSKKEYSQFVAEELRNTLDEYLSTYYILSSKIQGYDRKIEELAERTRYNEKVKRLGCLLGVKTLTAMAVITETGDFNRFADGAVFSAYLGLVPNENSSGDDKNRGRLTKTGNRMIRKQLVESAHGISRGMPGYKSKALKARQALCSSTEVITYADMANIRMRKKYYKMIRNGKQYNVAVAAVARELACFIWGIMTDNIEIRTK